MHHNNLTPKTRLVGLLVLLLLASLLPLILFNAHTQQSVITRAATSGIQPTTFTPGTVPGCQFQKADNPVNVAFVIPLINQWVLVTDLET